MTSFALVDASAVLAMLLDEPGGKKVKELLEGAVLGAVNLAEIVSHYAKLGASRLNIEAMLRPLPIRVVPIDAALSYDAGMLRPLTLPGGLSLGDRYYLALAKREGVPALTAERPLADHRGGRWRDRGADPLGPYTRAHQVVTCKVECA